MIIINPILHSENAKDDKTKITSSMLNGLKFRSVGPAVCSGRIIDITVNPNNFDEFYISTAASGLWKTTNHGINFTAVFENEASYSVGTLAIDPNNTNVLWLGSGENNSQRAVGYGDGIYKSEDAGKTWKNMGLKNSEHIAKIYIDPRNSNIIFVACQGPLWKSGGDRGLYISTDAGLTWNKSLYISENTGVSDLVVDQRNPNIMYASSYQRRRHVWTLINGGPEAAVYKSIDAGKNWTKLSQGLPSGDLGRIGLGISPVNPDIVFALIEANDSKGGLYKSTDRGASWDKVNSIATSSAQYYQELFCDPVDVNTLYSVNTYTQVSTDGGKTFSSLSNKERHVDDHAIWINPKNNKHLLIGGDGGLYESYDAGQKWRFYENLPISQFYRVSVDNALPFYNLYGGTQDNNTLGGPSRTTNSSGITNEDWIYTVGGDGFETVIDPKNPNIVYSQPQYGALVRYDKLSGEMTGIQPQAEPGEELRWNWDSPVIISPHSNTRLYFAANRLFKSDDKGNNWKAISPDLTRQIQRNNLEVMGKIWNPDAVAKNASTSLYGNIVSLDESAIKQGLLYVGTDDGLIQVSENDGQNWTKIESFPGVPANTYVSDIFASLHNENVVYACFENHKMGDFKPYVMKSNDKGKTWTMIVNGLPENGTAYTISQDHVNPDLLFLGTEFSCYFSINAGNDWIKLASNLPTIPIKDIDIQRRENDLVLATFGRGFYILDDYSALRNLTNETLDNDAYIFPSKPALAFITNESKGRNSLGETFFRAENHPFGAVITYYIKNSLQTLKDKRKAAEKAKDGKNDGKYIYPSMENLRAEDLESSPYYFMTITNAKGKVVRRINLGNSTGIKRVTWDLKNFSTNPINKNTNVNTFSGMPVLPGKYTAIISKNENGNISDVSKTMEFEVKLLSNSSIPPTNVENLYSFYDNCAEQNKQVESLKSHLRLLFERVDLAEKATYVTEGANIKILSNLNKIKMDLNNLNIQLNGDNSKAKRNENQTPSINERLSYIFDSFWQSYSDPTGTAIKNSQIIKDGISVIYKNISDKELEIDNIEKELINSGSSYIPGKLIPINK